MHSNPSLNRPLAAIIPIYLLFLLGLFVLFQKGVSGPFLLDDSVLIDAYSSFGGVTDAASFWHFVLDFRPTLLGRPVSFASFLLDDQFAPASAESFKRTNILIHLLNGVLLLWLGLKVGRLLYGTNTKVAVGASLIAGIWLVLPIHASTVFYVVQRMAQLAFLFSLTGILFYISAIDVKSSLPLRFFKYLASAVCILLAVLSKESGVLCFLYLLLLHCLVFSRQSLDKVAKTSSCLFIYIPCIAIAVYLVFSFDGFLASYSYRDFSMSERVFTQMRVLWSYFQQIAFPRISGMGLYHDDIVYSTSFFSPISTLIGGIGHLLMLLLAVLARRKATLISIGIVWFYSSHVLESTFIPLEMYFEHRNYSAAFGVLVAIAGLLIQIARYVQEPILKMLPYFVGAAYLVGAVLLVPQSALTWSNEEMLYSTWAMEHPNSKRAQRKWLGYIYDEANYERVYDYARELRGQFPSDLGFRLSVITAACRIEADEKASFDQILADPNTLVAHENVVTSLLHLEDLVLNRQCDFLDVSDLHNLYTAMRLMEHARGHWKATLFGYEAELFVKEADFNGAMVALDNALLLRKQTNVYMRQSYLLLTAGLLDLAQSKFNEAVKANQQRRRSEPDMSDELGLLANKISNARILP